MTQSHMDRLEFCAGAALDAWADWLTEHPGAVEQEDQSFLADNFDVLRAALRQYNPAYVPMVADVLQVMRSKGVTQEYAVRLLGGNP